MDDFYFWTCESCGSLSLSVLYDENHEPYCEECGSFSVSNRDDSEDDLEEGYCGDDDNWDDRY